MSTANTAKIAVDIDSTAWKFAPDSVTLRGHTFAAGYSVARTSGDVYIHATVEGAALRLHVGKGTPAYHAALEAAMAAKQPAKQAEKPAEKPAEQPAKQAAPKAAKPAKAAKQPKPAAEPAKPVEQPTKQPAKQAEAKPAEQPKRKHVSKAFTRPEPAKPVEQPAEKPAEQPAKQAEPDAKAWIGTAITGKGWRIAFDEATQRTRVSFDAAPSAKQKEAVEAAGFYWSAQLGSWNKKLTCKAHRAAVALAATLTSLS